MRVLVTGSGGFLGGELCRLLAARNHSPVGVGRTPGAGVDIVHDLSLAPLSVSEPFDAVVHAASVLPMPDRTDYEENLAIVQNTCVPALADAYHLLVSSVSVYPYGEIPSTPQPAGSIVRSCNTYGDSKRAQELFVTSFAAGRAGIIRPSSIYGPGMKGSTVLPAMLRHADATGLLEVRGSTRYKQSFVFVSDVARLAAAMLEGCEGRTQHAFGDRPVDMVELATLIAAATATPVEIHDARDDDVTAALMVYPDHCDEWRGSLQTTRLEAGIARCQKQLSFE